MWVYPINFKELRRELLNLPSGTHVKMPISLEKNLTAGLQRTIQGRLKGALKQYRDKFESKSVHIRVYKDHLEAHLDKRNPIYKPIEHLIEDSNESLLTVIALSSLALFALILWFKDRLR